MDSFENMMSEVEGLMDHSFSLADRDNQKYVTELGRRLNNFLDNMVEIPLSTHKQLLNEIEILFRKIKRDYIDNMTNDDINRQYGEYPRLLVQFKHIREMIRNFLSTSGEAGFVLKFKYRFAKQALIQLYFMSHEMDNTDIWNNTNIHDYERPVTFYEYEISSLVDSMDEL